MSYLFESVEFMDKFDEPFNEIIKIGTDEILTQTNPELAKKVAESMKGFHEARAIFFEYVSEAYK